MLRVRPGLIGFIESCLPSPADRPPAGRVWSGDQGLVVVMSAALALLCATIAPGHAQDDADRYWRAVMGPSVLTPAQEQAAESGAEFTECANGCPTMIVVPAGSYMMGSPATETDRSANEGPQHRVTIAKPFAVGKTEVTFAQWEACVAAAACRGGT